MFTEEKKKKTNYGSVFVYFFFCVVLVVGLVRFAKPYYNLKKNLMETAAVVEEEFFDVKSSGNLPCQFSRSRSVSVPVRNNEKLSTAMSSRDNPPTSYCVKFESYKTMLKQVKNGKYESRPFSAGGYNWSFIIYPNGNKEDKVTSYVSAYVRIQNSSHLTSDVYAELKFFLYSKTKNQYYAFRDKEQNRFSVFAPEWGVPFLHHTGSFDAYGFIFDGGQTVYGVDIFVTPPFDKWEVFSNEENIRDPLFDWKLTKFSNRYLDSYTSASFTSGGKNWVLKVYPNGVGPGTGNSLSFYLVSESNENSYVQAKLRILDQIRFTHVEKQVEGWPDAGENGWGFDKFIPLADIKDASKGFLVNDTLKVEVEIVSFSKTDSFSN